ncbi:MAG: outer membrane protein assembly factor BamE [Sterolibacterium sp.]|jgi:outer membrane protein assembly factor BamE|nr:outer membrane protein assembly factor BamE [Sterolibacterium sp.]MBP9799369.1 outer membrane protein assembly factor BamE [Sterolibacterium sp.]
MTIPPSLLLIPACALLTACAATPEISSLLTPYRIDVRQGNHVTQEMVAQLKTGQSKEQVRFILGTPLIADPFHAERWDYLYRFQPGRGEAQQRRITLFFSDDKLARITGDTVGKETSITHGVVDIEPIEKTGMKIEPGMTLPSDK